MQSVEQIEYSLSVKLTVRTAAGVVDKEPLPVSDIFVTVKNATIHKICVDLINDSVFDVISPLDRRSQEFRQQVKFMSRHLY